MGSDIFGGRGAREGLTFVPGFEQYEVAVLLEEDKVAAMGDLDLSCCRACIGEWLPLLTP